MNEMLNFETQKTAITYQTKIVMGVTKFKGVVENNQIDTCTVLVAMPLDVDSGNAAGFGVAKVPFGDSTNFHKFAGINFPATLELAFATVTGSSGKSKDILKDFKHPSHPKVKE